MLRTVQFDAFALLVKWSRQCRQSLCRFGVEHGRIIELHDASVAMCTDDQQPDRVGSLHGVNQGPSNLLQVVASAVVMNFLSMAGTFSCLVHRALMSAFAEVDQTSIPSPRRAVMNVVVNQFSRSRSK